MTNVKKGVTFRQLIEAIEKMPSELLDKKIVTWPSDDSEIGHVIVELEILEEDYRFDGDNGSVAESIMKDTYEEWDADENYVVHQKGTIILITD